MRKQTIQYHSPKKPGFKLRPPLRSAVAVLAGLLIAAYCGFGAAFVEGGVEHGDPSVTRTMVCILLLVACFGILLAAWGFFGPPGPETGIGKGDGTAKSDGDN